MNGAHLFNAPELDGGVINSVIADGYEDVASLQLRSHTCIRVTHGKQMGRCAARWPEIR